MFKYVDNIEDVCTAVSSTTVYFATTTMGGRRGQKYAGGTTRDKEKLRGVILHSQRISDEPRALGSL